MIEGQISFRSASGLHVPPFIVYPGLWDSLGLVLSCSWLCLVLPWSGSWLGLNPLKPRSCLDLIILHSWSWLGPKPSKSWSCLGLKTRPMAFVVSVSTDQGLGLVSMSIHSGLCLDLVWNLLSLGRSWSRSQPRQSLGLVSIAIHFWSLSGLGSKPSKSWSCFDMDTLLVLFMSLFRFRQSWLHHCFWLFPLLFSSTLPTFLTSFFLIYLFSACPFLFNPGILFVIPLLFSSLPSLYPSLPPAVFVYLFIPSFVSSVYSVISNPFLPICPTSLPSLFYSMPLFLPSLPLVSVFLFPSLPLLTLQLIHVHQSMRLFYSVPIIATHNVEWIFWVGKHRDMFRHP